MPRLFSYTIPVDDGAAPNPFGGLCTLVICKPAIRRTAEEGDWIAGLGSKRAPSGDLSGRLVYAMRVDEVLPMAEYDSQAKNRWPFRIPDVESKDLARRLGDCIYDYSKSSDRPRQRDGVHNETNRDTDIGGRNALISRHFYYFGSKALPLPPRLQGICHQTQAHRSNANAEFVKPFLEWIDSLKLDSGQLYGWPDYIVKWGDVTRLGCRPRKEDGECDSPC
jgi:hypothetical protein